jgi:hypothetical protein
MTRAKAIIEALSADDLDPKDVALNTEFDSELFRDFMHNYQEECRKLLKQAQASGALSGDEPPGVLIRIIMRIAADNFNVKHPENKSIERNLRRFL